MKPRSDSKLDCLPEEQKAQLADWLLRNGSYVNAKAMVKDQFGVDTSLASLHHFYHNFCSSELLARRKRAVTTADEIAKEAEAMPGKFDAATIDALKQKAFEYSINPGANPRDVKDLFSLVLKARDQELQEKDTEIKLRRLEIIESQLRETREKLASEKGGNVDPQKLAEEIDRILGRKA